MHDNNCDAMRLGAAFTVVVSHSFMLTAGHNEWEPVFRLSHGQTTAGGLAVFAFFVLSGYLIARSFERTASLRLFALARVVRILPALLIALLVTAFVAGPILSKLPLAAYLRDPGPYRYVLWNASLLQYSDGLPGVFASNPMPGVVNGSLWTLHIEVVCYMATAALGAMRLLTRNMTAVLLAAGVLLTALSDPVSYPLLLATHFMAGAVYHLWRPACRPGVLAGCAAALLGSMLMGGFLLMSATAGAYLLCSLAFGPYRFGEVGRRVRQALGRADLSYGTYIWAFPIQQVIVQAMGSRVQWWQCATLAVPLALIPATLSWYAVEQPALRWRHGAGLRRVTPVPAAVVTMRS